MYALTLGFSSFLTLGAGFQCLGFVLLALKVQNQSGASGLSGKTLAMYALTLCFRLSSTVHLNGYLPVDQTGDWLLDALHICHAQGHLPRAARLISTHIPACGDG